MYKGNHVVYVFLFLQKYDKDVKSIGWDKERAHHKLDINKVDLKVFTNFLTIPWWNATMEAGDCLFIPVE